MSNTLQDSLNNIVDIMSDAGRKETKNQIKNAVPS